MRNLAAFRIAAVLVLGHLGIANALVLCTTPDGKTYAGDKPPPDCKVKSEYTSAPTDGQEAPPAGESPPAAQGSSSDESFSVHASQARTGLERALNDDAARLADIRVRIDKVKTMELQGDPNFAAIHPARTVNPHDPARTPGGSSSGSAAAVADGMVWAALGTQTAGSVIRPAAFCGVVGYKPTFGTVNCAGLKPLSEFTDTIGVLARTVADAASVVAAAAGRPELRRLGTPPARPRIALCRTPYWEQAEAPAREALAAAAEPFRAAGAVVVDCENETIAGNGNTPFPLCVDHTMRARARRVALRRRPSGTPPPTTRRSAPTAGQQIHHSMSILRIGCMRPIARSSR